MTVRSLSLRLALLGGGLVVGLLLAEGALRLFPLSERPRSTGLDTKHSSARLKPDHRGRPAPRRKRPGTFRILAVGDSFTWGAGVHAQDAWPRRLGEALGALGPERPVEVVSWSRPGWNTRDEWRSLGGELRRLDPDLLLLAYTLNDAELGTAAERQRLRRQFRAPRPTRSWSRSLHRSSVLYRTLYERVSNLLDRRRTERYHLGLYRRPGWEEAVAALKRIARWGRERSMPVELIVFPIFEPGMNGRYAYAPIHREVARRAGEIGLPTVDLLPVYLGVDPARLAVEPFRDPHPSEIAHRLAADALLHHLVREGLVPVPERTLRGRGPDGTLYSDPVRRPQAAGDG